jgi:4-amino-4-deoxy-L-arabinose transferase-like glycosyltransferase
MKTDFFKSNLGAILLLLFIAGALFVNLGNLPLFDEDEGAYAEVTREMLETGNFLTPRLEGKPFFHKPPMIYWTQALSVRLFGLNEFAFRLPSAIASLVWAVLLFYFVRRYVGRQTAWFAAFFLVTSIQTGVITKAAIADALLNLFICLTMFAIYAHFKTGKRRYMLAAFLGMGLGFITKGPIALAIPVVVSFIFYLLNKRFTEWLKTAFNPLGWFLFLIIALPWYLALYAEYGAHFVREMFLVHNLGRFQGAMEGHSGPIFYYIPVVILGLMPFTIILLSAFAKIKRQWQNELGRYLIIWFAFVFILFSLAGTKLHHYVVYGYVPLLIFMAQRVDKIKNGAWLVAPGIIGLAILLVLPTVATFVIPLIHDDFAKLVVAGAMAQYGLGIKIAVAITLAATIFLGFSRRLDNRLKTVVLGLLLIVFGNGFLAPMVAGIMQQPVKEAALLAKKNNYAVVMWAMNYPSFNVYYGRTVLRHTPQPGDIVITKASKLNAFKAHEVIYEKHGVVLTRVEKFHYDGD